MPSSLISPVLHVQKSLNVYADLSWNVTSHKIFAFISKENQESKDPSEEELLGWMEELSI